MNFLLYVCYFSQDGGGESYNLAKVDGLAIHPHVRRSPYRCATIIFIGETDFVFDDNTTIRVHTSPAHDLIETLGS